MYQREKRGVNNARSMGVWGFLRFVRKKSNNNTVIWVRAGDRLTFGKKGKAKVEIKKKKGEEKKRFPVCWPSGSPVGRTVRRKKKNP